MYLYFSTLSQIRGPLYIYQQAVNDLPSMYRYQLSSVSYHVKQTDGSFSCITLESGEGLYQLRLINPQRLERKTVQALLKDSEPWVGLTGDASWIEGLIRGKIIFYQVVIWKSQFFSKFMMYMDTKMKSSLLFKFYMLQWRQPGQENSFSQMRELYQNNLPELQRDAAHLATSITEEKNLSNYLHGRFFAQVSDAATCSEILSEEQIELCFKK